MSQTIVVLGESPLVEEYGGLCIEKRHRASGRINPGGGRKLPKGMKPASSIARNATLALELTNTSRETKKKNLMALDRSLPSGVPIVSSSVTVTVAEQSGWIRNPGRLMGLGALPSLLAGGLVELVRSAETADEMVARVREFFVSLGKETCLVQDAVGLVMPRILCMLVNESYFAMMEGVASADDIDTAMKLGTNYPSGPIEWAGRIGLRNTLAVLTALHTYFGEDRYRVAPLLRRAAIQGV
jgi:3-hydroxybutyryl-CoA dehydrogenase